eukprot:2005067-Amphidinium_carterae.1
MQSVALPDLQHSTQAGVFKSLSSMAVSHPCCCYEGEHCLMVKIRGDTSHNGNSAILCTQTSSKCHLATEDPLAANSCAALKSYGLLCGAGSAL